MRPLLVFLAMLATTVPASAKDRPLTFCLEDGEGGTAKKGVVYVWSEELEIVRDAQNAFTIGRDGCVEITSLAWNEVDMTLQAWMSVNYEVQAQGFYDSPGVARIDKKKKRNTKVIMLERKVGPS